jgi:hypothetical protein
MFGRTADDADVAAEGQDGTDAPEGLVEGTPSEVKDGSADLEAGETDDDDRGAEPDDEVRGTQPDDEHHGTEPDEVDDDGAAQLGGVDHDVTAEIDVSGLRAPEPTEGDEPGPEFEPGYSPRS